MFLISTATSFGQAEFCNSFKEGVFYIPPTEQLPISYRVERTAGEQTETVLSAPKGLLKAEEMVPQYGVLRWIDDCSYRIWFDESKGNLSEVQQMINRNNGVLIEFLSAEGDCITFRSTLAKEDEIISFLGQQCKE